jgi:NADH-quinone oxidoreductase subunit H
MLPLGFEAAGLSQAGLEGPAWFWWGAWLAVFLGIFPLIVAYLVLAERKLAARFQDRIGPNRVGPLGLLQPIADAIKLVTKENIVPRGADRWVHLLAPVLLIVSAFLVLAVIPFGVTSVERRMVPFGARELAEGRKGWYPGLAAMDTSSGLIYLVAASSLSVLGTFLAGWASRNKYAVLGAMRGAAQLVSYEIPQVLSLIPVILWSGGLSLVGIFNAQHDLGWFAASPPGLLGLLILTIASVAETNRAPFDIPEAESEIIAGYHTEYSGMRFGLFFLAEYLSVFGVSCLAVAVFLGGGLLLPFGGLPMGMNLGVVATNVVLIGVFLAKVSLYIFVIFWIRATLPRMRVDRLMAFSWKVLIPLSLVNVVAAVAWYEIGLRPGGAGVFVGWLTTLPPLVLVAWGLLRMNKRGDEPARPARAATNWRGVAEAGS